MCKYVCICDRAWVNRCYGIYTKYACSFYGTYHLFCTCDLFCENRPFQHIWYYEKHHFETLKPLQFSCDMF